MCGISSVLSKNNSNILDLLINSLSIIENRGYDSVGICYIDISNNYNRNFESYRIDLEQEDYNLYRKYILPSDHEDTSTADYQNFISNSGSRLDRAKKITETDSSGNTIGDNLYGVVGIFGNPIEEFAGLSMTNLFKELQTRYLQSLNQ